MNSAIEEKVEWESLPDESQNKSVESKLPTDRKILNTLYAHYGKPSRIEHEKVRFYLGYSSALSSQGDWKVDGWQMGRVNVYVSEDVMRFGEKTGLTRRYIPSEGVGTWFIAVKDRQIKVYIAGKVDTTLKISE